MNFAPKVADRLFADLTPPVRNRVKNYTSQRPESPVFKLSRFQPVVSERTLELFERAENPDDPFELRDLFLGRVECESNQGDANDGRALRWRSQLRKRRFSEQDILSSRATVRFIKELFNAYFRDELYGRFRSPETVVMSSGSVCEETFGLPDSVKACLRFSLRRDWYGYSDSRGRHSAREAIAAYESRRVHGPGYTAENVAITMGGTAAVSVLADMLLSGPRTTDAPALCPIPNYPPLVEAVARRRHVQQVPLLAENGRVCLDPLISALTPTTPLVLLQTVANPTGAVVDEDSIAKLIRAAAPSTMILLDECHEFLGPNTRRSALRCAPNVVRITSMSKTWSVPGMKIGWILADPTVIADFYEYASTSYGGPPSLFYTLVEVVTRFERWKMDGIEFPGPAELLEFDPAYGLSQQSLETAYQAYRTARNERECGLLGNRTEILSALQSSGFEVMAPSQSINAIISVPGIRDSYVAFREILSGVNVSLFPSALMFGYDGIGVRITTARNRNDLCKAADRLAAFACTADSGQA